MPHLHTPAEFFEDVRPSNRIFRPMFGQSQISRTITAAFFPAYFRLISQLSELESSTFGIAD